MKQFVLSCVLILLVAACSSVNVQTELDGTANLGALRSYGWLEATEASLKGVRVENPEVESWVKGAVEKEMMKKGYTMNSGGNPDFFISWFGAVETKVKVDSINHFYSSYGYGPVASSMPPESQLDGKSREYKEGSILLDVIDPVSQKILWRGVGTDKVLQDLDKEEVALYVNRVVKSILKSFPAAK